MSDPQLAARIALLVLPLLALAWLALSLTHRDPDAPSPTYMVASTGGLIGAYAVSAYVGHVVWIAASLALGLRATLEAQRALALPTPTRALSAAAITWATFTHTNPSLALTGAAPLAALATLAATRRAPAALLSLAFPGLGAVCLTAFVLRTGFAGAAFLFALVEVNDSAGYVCGRVLGGPKLCPRLSPRKTWSGALAGLAATALAALAFQFCLPNLTHPLPTGAAAALAAQAGDLLASTVKRRAGLKDFGHLLPVHGGALDIWDGLLFTAPFAYAWSLST